MSVCPTGCFPDPGMDLDLGEILLNLFNCKSTSWMGLKLYPVLILSEDVPALNAPPGPFEGGQSCPAYKDLPVQRRRRQEPTLSILIRTN